MSFHSFMMLTVADDNNAELIKIWKERRCIEEAAETIAGFKYGEVLASDEDPRVTYIHCCWEKESCYQAWLDSPLRNKQIEDLTPIANVLEIKNILLTSKHLVEV
ncbi:antibiotic biosynthesis monooxygenase [Shewanella olleyana]|uniref:antibiotic biosynthesis monooxygenase family protein n=1 Tax=Shewanella olleyana TaxID=135626 RepID=UPI00200BD7F9|nr:antibiotic biosynthesis monooxygenase [Shewanella olleyana]MCL1066704.1 antibiotic biosynthesis monooxygenase [Shewanella olleyana]